VKHMRFTFFVGDIPCGDLSGGHSLCGIIIIIILFKYAKQQRARPKNTYNTMLKLLQIATMLLCLKGALCPFLCTSA